MIHPSIKRILENQVKVRLNVLKTILSLLKDNKFTVLE